MFTLKPSATCMPIIPVIPVSKTVYNQQTEFAGASTPQQTLKQTTHTRQNKQLNKHGNTHYREAELQWGTCLAASTKGYLQKASSVNSAPRCKGEGPLCCAEGRG